MQTSGGTMTVVTESIDLPAAGAPMRAFLARPARDGRYPGLLLYSDIFALTASMQRAIVRFASYGFVVVAPEIYHRFEPAGRALDFIGDYARAQDDATKVHAADIDADLPAVLEFLRRHPAVRADSLHATGFCLGGHLAFRAALQPAIRSTVAFYPTGLHTGSLGGDDAVDTLARCSEIRGAMLVVFGANDPHVPVAGRRAIDDALRSAGVRYALGEYAAEHAFMRDEGPRYDAAETDRAMLQATQFLYQHA